MNKIIILFVSIVLFIACEDVPTAPQDILQATVTILATGNNGESTSILFKVENTGNVYIDNWYVSFQVITDNDVFNSDAGGQNLAVGKSTQGTLWISTLDEIVSVQVMEIKY